MIANHGNNNTTKDQPTFSYDNIASLEKEIKAISMLQRQITISSILFNKSSNDQYATTLKRVNSKLTSIIPKLLLVKRPSLSMEYNDLVEGVEDMLEHVSESIDIIKGIKKENNIEEIEKEIKLIKQNEEAKQVNKLQSKKDVLPPTDDAFDIDNSYYPFIPKLKVKYNAISELNADIEDARQRRLSIKEKLMVRFSDAKDKSLKTGVALFTHPYQKEIRVFIKALSEKYSKMKEDMNKAHNRNDIIQFNSFDYTDAGNDTEANPYHFTERRYPPLNHTPLLYIQTLDELTNMINELSIQSSIAVDLEHHNKESYLGLTCLMQISSRTKDYIIDTFSLRYHLSELNKVFTNRSILKVFHGADYDIEWLQKDFGLYVVNMFDTGQASRMIKAESFSLKHLLHKYCAIEADKTYQLADWRLRPLTPEMIKYAREDTHYLLYIYDCLVTQLIKDGINKTPEDPFFFLVKVYEKSAEICLKEYTKPKVKSQAYYQYMAINSHRPMREQYLLKTIYKFRDYVGRKLDYNPENIMTKAQMGKLCRLGMFDYGSVVKEIPNCFLFNPFVNEFVEVINETIGKFNKKQSDRDLNQREVEYCNKVKAMMMNQGKSYKDNKDKDRDKVKFNYSISNANMKGTSSDDRLISIEELKQLSLPIVAIKSKVNSAFIGIDINTSNDNNNNDKANNDIIDSIKQQFTNFNIVSYLKDKHNLNSVTLKVSSSLTTASAQAKTTSSLLNKKHPKDQGNEDESRPSKVKKTQQLKDKFSRFNDITDNQSLYEKLRVSHQQDLEDSSEEEEEEEDDDTHNKTQTAHPSLVNKTKEIETLMNQRPKEEYNKHRYNKKHKKK